ncbi:hypothetical protein ACU4GG_17000 [Streptomyces nojiriensis]
MMIPAARVVALAVAVAVAVVAGCTTSDPETKASRSVKPPEVALTEACPGLISDAAGEALKDVLQSSYLVNDDAQAVGVKAMGKALEEAHRGAPSGQAAAVPACTVTGSVGRGHRTGEIRLAAESLKPGASGSDRTGVRVTGADKERGVAFGCVSPRVGSTREMPLRITASYKDRFQDSKGDAVLGQAYLVLAHSAALAVAKELGCETNGGLPDGVSALPRSGS